MNAIASYRAKTHKQTQKHTHTQTHTQTHAITIHCAAAKRAV